MACRSRGAAGARAAVSRAAVPQADAEAQGSLPRPGAPLDLHGLLGAVSGARDLPRTVATPGDQSPLKLAAKCRDARVPYTFPFSDFLATQKKQKTSAAAGAGAGGGGGGGGGGLALPSLPSPSLPSLPKLPF